MQGQPPPPQPAVQYIQVPARQVSWNAVGGVCAFIGVAIIGVGLLVLALDFSTYFNALQAGSVNPSVITNWENGIVNSLVIIAVGTIVSGLAPLFRGLHKGA